MAYCDRCDRQFGSFEALDQHARDSNSHWTCPTCDYDYRTLEELRQHRREAHSYCGRCDRDLWYELGTFETLLDHEIEQHDRCDECGRFFESESNLRSHKRTHSPRNVSCYGEYAGCQRTFDCVSAMILHLEQGTCCSGMDIDTIDKLAFRCYQKKHYTTSKDVWFKYFCPTCGTSFSKMSAVLQHAESRACSEDIETWPMNKVLHFIEVKT